jgi:hypothetical protein
MWSSLDVRGRSNAVRAEFQDPVALAEKTGVRATGDTPAG